LDKIGPLLLAVLDRNYEFQVGLDIVSFENGKYLRKPLSEKNNLDFQKEEIGHRQVSYIPIDSNGKTEFDMPNRVDVWSNGGTSPGEDLEFTKNTYAACNSNYTSGVSSRR
jgi:hypothetical protein